MNKKTISAPTCGLCGTEMKFKPCSECGGTGGVRTALIFKKDCSMCAGSGGQWRCPEEELHSKSSLNVPSQPLFTLSSSEPIFPASQPIQPDES